VCRDVKGRTQDKTCDVAVNVSVGKVQVVRSRKRVATDESGLGRGSVLVGRRNEPASRAQRLDARRT
jgi:hypothetical protein